MKDGNYARRLLVLLRVSFCDFPGIAHGASGHVPCIMVGHWLHCWCQVMMHFWCVGHALPPDCLKTRVSMLLHHSILDMDCYSGQVANIRDGITGVEDVLL